MFVCNQCSRDTHRLIRFLKRLPDIGNTIIVVEHGADVMRAPDHIVEAGEAGSGIDFESNYPALMERLIIFRGACANNLKNIDVAVPLDRMVCIPGVSGSGKSTLVHHVIHKTLEDHLRESGQISVLGGRFADSHLPQSEKSRTAHHRSSTPESGKRGYTPGHFSFNIPGGRCETCLGQAR